MRRVPRVLVLLLHARAERLLRKRVSSVCSPPKWVSKSISNKVYF